MEGNCDTNNIDFKYRVNRKQEIMLNSSIELDEKKKKKRQRDLKTITNLGWMKGKTFSTKVYSEMKYSQR